MRGEHGSVDAIYVIADRDSEIGGGLMAGALAYRLFIWLLPFALVVVGGIGIAAERRPSRRTSATHVARARAASSSNSVAEAIARAPRAGTRSLIGIPILLWATRSLLQGARSSCTGSSGATCARTVPKPTVARDRSGSSRSSCAYFAIQRARALGRRLDRELHPAVTVAGLVALGVWWLARLAAAAAPRGAVARPRSRARC